MDKRKLYIIFTIIIAVLLPSAVFASVIIDQAYTVSTTTTTNPIIMTEGPNYKDAHTLGFATLVNGTTSTGNKITFGYVANDTSVILLNVLEIKNDSSVAKTTNVTLTVSSTIDITIYYSPTQATVSGTTVSGLGTPLTTSGTTFTLPSGTIEYISVEITGTITSDTLTMSYAIQ